MTKFNTIFEASKALAAHAKSKGWNTLAKTTSKPAISPKPSLFSAPFLRFPSTAEVNKTLTASQKRAIEAIDSYSNPDPHGHKPGPK